MKCIEAITIANGELAGAYREFETASRDMKTILLPPNRKPVHHRNLIKGKKRGQNKI